MALTKHRKIAEPKFGEDQKEYYAGARAMNKYHEKGEKIRPKTTLKNSKGEAVKARFGAPQDRKTVSLKKRARSGATYYGFDRVKDQPLSKHVLDLRGKAKALKERTE